MIKTKMGIKTPYYQYDPKRLEENIQLFNNFSEIGVDILYAIKANNYEPLVRRCIKEGYGFDVASKEEIEYIRNLGGNMSKSSFSAPTKLNEDIKYANMVGIEKYAFDSEEELRKICKIVKNPKLFARMSVRNKDATFNLSESFGMTENYFRKIIAKAKINRWPIYGITFHVGSQNTSVLSWTKALKEMESLLKIARAEGIEIKSLNIGGGIPVPYENGLRETSSYVHNLSKLITRFKKKTGIEEVIVEPGRAMCANTMILFTRVVNMKKYKRPPIIVTDLSVFNGLIEPLEHFEYPVFEYKNQDSRTSGLKRKVYQICGISCDGYDIIRKQCLLPADIKIGDLLVIPFAGAYSFVYENFHMRKFPPIYSKER